MVRGAALRRTKCHEVDGRAETDLSTQSKRLSTVLRILFVRLQLCYPNVSSPAEVFLEPFGTILRDDASSQGRQDQQTSGARTVCLHNGN